MPIAWWAGALAVFPFLLIPAAHLASGPETATGLFHYELPYYVANGRAAFERGNGILYPNPFDPAADAPVIYAHWLPQILGAATAKLGADPGMLVIGLTVAAALALTVATGRLLQACAPDSPLLSVGLVASMWGGGCLVVVSGMHWLVAGDGPVDWLQLDPGNGMWFLNWGRNALFPTEATYHTLCALCWLAEIRRQRRFSTLCFVLLATTHPWSGLELLLTVNLWRGACWLQHRDRDHLLAVTVSATVLALFLGYYKIWLPSFPQHAALQTVWELDWSLGWSSAFPAWGLVALAAAWRLWKQPDALRSHTVQFLLCALSVSLALSLHDRIISPVQPLHFTRGYVWMPLFLLAVPVLLDRVQWLWRQSAASRVAVICLALLFVTDNLVFAVIQCGHQYDQQDGFHLDYHDRALLAELHNRYPGEVLLSDSETLNYLLPAYAGLRPWLGHQFNTPDFASRVAVKDCCFPGGTVNSDAIPADVTVIAAQSIRNLTPLGANGHWIRSGIANARWTVWLRIQRLPANGTSGSHAP